MVHRGVLRRAGWRRRGLFGCHLVFNPEALLRCLDAWRRRSTAMGLMLLASCVAQPAMPVRVEYDLTPRTEGIKVRLHNHGHRSLWVTVEFINHERGLSRTVKLFLPAGAGHEVGWYDGWKFEPGECVRIKHGDFQDKHVCLE